MIKNEHNTSYKQSILNFLKGAIDFTGYTDRTNHWIPVSSILIVLMFLFAVIVDFSISSIKRLSITNLSMLNNIYNAAEIFGYIVGLVTIITIFPLTASFARRLRDVGFNNYPIIILIVIFYFLSYFHITILSTVYFFFFFFILMLLDSNFLETNQNDSLSVFMFRQTKQAKELYSNINERYYNNKGFSNDQNLNNNKVQPISNDQQPNKENINNQKNVDNEQNIDLNSENNKLEVEEASQNNKENASKEENKVKESKIEEKINKNPFGDEPINK